jgi:hypothetical protein
MAVRATDLIVVVDASTLVSAALKTDSLPERALLRAVNEPNRLLLSAVIVSSDIHHLLSMHPWRGIQILSPADYLALKEA